MAFDDRLATRVRDEVAAQTGEPTDERRMFGGLALMVAGHMAVCVTSEGLMVKVGEDDAARLAEAEHVEPMVMGGRRMRAWLVVGPPAVAADDALAGWVARGVAVARSLPPQG